MIHGLTLKRSEGIMVQENQEAVKLLKAKDRA